MTIYVDIERQERNMEYIRDAWQGAREDDMLCQDAKLATRQTSFRITFDEMVVDIAMGKCTSSVEHGECEKTGRRP
jgi:hypothetical protein